MRRLVAALVLAAVVVALTACGGGGDATSSSASDTSSDANAAAAAPAAPAPAAQTAAVDNSANTLSPREQGTGVPFPSEGPMVPKPVANRVQAKQPMLVMFYDPIQPSTKDERREINAAMKGYRGLIDVVELDTTTALPDPVTGQAKKDVLSQQTALLAQTLKVQFTPYMVFVDRKGIITGRFRGYVDRGLIEREIIRATQ